MNQKQKNVLALALTAVTTIFFFCASKIDFLYRSHYYALIVTAIDVLSAAAIFVLSRSQMTRNDRGFFHSFLIFLAIFSLTNLFYTVYKSYVVPVTPQVFGAPTAAELSSRLEVFLTVILAPITEEIGFRLCLIGVASVFIKRMPALIFSAIIFAFMHLYRTHPYGIPLYLCLGISLGVTYLFLGLRWSIFFHFVINFLSNIATPHGWLESKAVSRPLSFLMLIGFLYFLATVFKLLRGKFNNKFRKFERQALG